MPRDWRPFYSGYKAAPNAKTFYSDSVEAIVKEKAKKVDSENNYREALNLLTQDDLEAADPFNWKHSSSSRFLSEVFADFAELNGSDHPEYDAMLMLKRCVALAPTLNPELPSGVEISIENGNLTLKKDGEILIYEKPLLDIAALEREHEAEIAAVLDRQSALREEIAASGYGLGEIKPNTRLHLRPGKADYTSSLRVLQPGEEIYVKRIPGSGWLKVTTKDGLEGYAYGKGYITVTREPGALRPPVIEPEPPVRKPELIVVPGISELPEIDEGVEPELIVAPGISELPEIDEGVEPIDRLEGIESPPESMPWNEDVILTFDDQLLGAGDIIRTLESQGIPNCRFYTELGTTFTDLALLDFGLAPLRNGRPNLAKMASGKTPGKWLDIIDANRGAMSREEYMRSLMKASYLQEADEIREFYQAKYPENWKEKIKETFCYHAGVLHADSADETNHIQYWNAEQIQGDIEFFEVAMNALFQLDDYQVSHLRPPMGGGFGYDSAFGRNTGDAKAEFLTRTVDEFRPGATWDLWSVDSGDTGRGITLYSDVAREALNYNSEASEYGPDESLVLFHTRHYQGAGKNLDEFIQAMHSEYSKKNLLVYPEDQRRRGFATQSITLWSPEGERLDKIPTRQAFTILALDSSDKDPGYYVQLETGEYGFVAQKYVKEMGMVDIDSYESELSGNEVLSKGATVNLNNAPFFQEPDLNSSIRRTLDRGTRVFVQGEVPNQPGWVKVTLEAPTTISGFLHLSQLTVEHREKPESLPEVDAMVDAMLSIPEQYRHNLTKEDRTFILGQTGILTPPPDKSQYLVIVNRGKQFAALVYFDQESGDYTIIGEHASKTSTGRQNVRGGEWATPTGIYDRGPIQERADYAGVPEWRTDSIGGGGYGQAGSRVFSLGNVDVNSPLGKDLSVAMHKTNESAKSALGAVAASHGCVRTADEFIDLLDENFLLDGDYGRYVIVGDSRPNVEREGDGYDGRPV